MSHRRGNVLLVRVSPAPDRRILDLDTECRPLAYLGQDYTTGEVTAIAAAWVDKPDKVHTWLLGEVDQATMLQGFRALYDDADMVTAHNLRKHDLPLLNGALLEANLPTLTPKLTEDTYRDLVKRAKLSVSQASLAGILGLEADKYDMSQPKWREANRLTKAGLVETRKRVTGDVRQHIELRAALHGRGLLKPPRVWTP